MFPMEFDSKLLGSLPFPDEQGLTRVRKVLLAIVQRRVLPYFRARRGTDPLSISRVRDQIQIRRLEDESGEIRGVSFLRILPQGLELSIHERIFDFLAFVIPSDPESRLAQGTKEERKMLAWSELLLRHEVEHGLYPETDEGSVVEGDLKYALEMKTSDPTYYRNLVEALADEMNGIKGRRYLALMDHYEEGRPIAAGVRRLLEEYSGALAESPLSFLQEMAPHLDPQVVISTLGHCLRQSRNTFHSLTKRASWMDKVLGILAGSLEGRNGHKVLEEFKTRWGIESILRELDLWEGHMEGKTQEEMLQLLEASLKGRSFKRALEVKPREIEAVEPREPEPQEKTLKDRIEEAKSDPLFPRQVIEVIERNKINAVGHSGSKYSELIETLLAIPWGKFKPIEVSPEEFEEGLNKSHYGLQRPKEILCDFFTNLIWRYRNLGPRSEKWAQWKRTGSAFLLVGPPGVGKTSLAISVAQNLSIPYHKISLGGMRDEADLRGHGFTYEGSKPGAIVQGLIKMGAMNGMFIMDEADKTEKFAIATLLEILDPEQNHLFHDKYTQTTVDIDLSNCHFMLTANTLETVPPPVANRCEIIFLDRYSVEEKIAIAKKHLIARVRQKHQIPEEEIFFDPSQEDEIIRLLIRNYTHEAGVRELERVIRTLFLRIQRKEIMGKGSRSVCITRETIKEFLEEPQPPRRINPEDRVGEMMALGVNPELGLGSVIPIQATPLPSFEGTHSGRLLSIVHATGNIERIMDESRKVATTGLLHCARELGIDLDKASQPVHLHFMGASTRKDGPSAGGAIALALASLLTGKPVRRDVAMTGELDTRGRITAVGALDLKLETAFEAGCKTMIIPLENLRGEGGIERLPEALKRELHILTFEEWNRDHDPFDYGRHILQIVGVQNLVEAAKVAFVEEEELRALEERFLDHASEMASQIQGTEQRMIFAILVKDLEEMDPRFMERSFWERCSGCILLVVPNANGPGPSRLDPIRETVRIREFDPRKNSLTEALGGILKEEETEGRGVEGIALSAPFFFIQRDGIVPEAFPPRGRFSGLRLFANNYTAQGVKIKSCKPLLNLVYSKMALLREEDLEGSFFLKKVSGIWVVDLSFIPEKYRLDVERAEKILSRCMERWLARISGGA